LQLPSNKIDLGPNGQVA